MQETNQLTNKMDGKETHKHPLEKEESLKQEVEEHVSNYFADTRKWVRFPPRYLESQVRYILQERKELTKTFSHSVVSDSATP